ncbi:unnamed protein product, partial [Haemonchus placei]|uniref:Uncharacterized protein n=1 Tax=Haemonchus placei TaxID=6290 RepID=A0A0N4VSN2_HAEPC
MISAFKSCDALNEAHFCALLCFCFSFCGLMADCAGPLRPADSWSTTEVRSVNHSHVWTIKGFSQCECRYLETSAKIRDLTVTPMPLPPTSTPNVSAATLEPPMLTFRIRLHPQGNKESNKDFSFFQVRFLFIFFYLFYLLSFLFLMNIFFHLVLTFFIFPSERRSSAVDGTETAVYGA